MFSSALACAQAQDMGRGFSYELSFSTQLYECERFPLAGEALAAPVPKANGGNAFRTTYHIDENHSLSVGISYFRTTNALGFHLSADDYPSLPFDINGPHVNRFHNLGIPLSYGFGKPLSDGLRLVSGLGYVLVLPLMPGQVRGQRSYVEDGVSHPVLAASYQRARPSHGLWLELGLAKKLRNNDLKASIFVNIPTRTQTFGTYVFFPEQPELSSSGQVKSGFGFWGISVGYVFAKKRRG